MRILSYNIYNCLGASQAFAALVSAVEPLDAATLLLNEYRTNDDGDRLCAALERAGYVHRAIGRSAARPGANRNCVAVFSREPFETLVNREDLRMVAVRQAGLILCAYHASPRGVAAVLPEVDEVTGFLAGRDDVVLAGDMNSLTAADRELLDYDTAAPALDRYREGDALSFAAIDRILRAGLRDMSTDAERHTVPTAVGRKAEAGHRLRLDYAFARGPATAALRSQILRGEPFDTLSDHYPVLIR